MIFLEILAILFGPWIIDDFIDDDDDYSIILGEYEQDNISEDGDSSIIIPDFYT